MHCLLEDIARIFMPLWVYGEIKIMEFGISSFVMLIKLNPLHLLIMRTGVWHNIVFDLTLLELVS